MESIIDQIEDFYETETVIRACIICDDESTLLSLTRELQEKHHSLDIILEDDLTDERATYARKLNTFQDASRMIAMSYATWYTIQDHVETDVLPYQNVVIVVNLEDGVVHHLASYLQDAAKRGFCMNDVKTHFLVLSSE
jgi:hypothetical protein